MFSIPSTVYIWPHIHNFSGQKRAERQSMEITNNHLWIILLPLHNGQPPTTLQHYILHTHTHTHAAHSSSPSSTSPPQRGTFPDVCNNKGGMHKPRHCFDPDFYLSVWNDVLNFSNDPRHCYMICRSAASALLFPRLNSKNE